MASPNPHIADDILSGYYCAHGVIILIQTMR
jgi:hypothetical protein